eukprot:2176073-Rhodomonas_salina.3
MEREDGGEGPCSWPPWEHSTHISVLGSTASQYLVASDPHLSTCPRIPVRVGQCLHRYEATRRQYFILVCQYRTLRSARVGRWGRDAPSSESELPERNNWRQYRTPLSKCREHGGMSLPQSDLKPHRPPLAVVVWRVWWGADVIRIEQRKSNNKANRNPRIERKGAVNQPS